MTQTDTNGFFLIPFTQYLLPDGRARTSSIGVEGATAVHAKTILDRGFVFESEILTTGEVALTVHDPHKEEDIAIEVVPNGPEIVAAVDRLAASAAATLSPNHGDQP